MNLILRIVLSALIQLSIVTSQESPRCGTFIWNRKLTGDGESAELGEFPWLVLLEYYTSFGIRIGCGGVLISDRYVLTAAHCLESNMVLARVRLGEHDTRTIRDCEWDGDSLYCNDESVFVGVEKIIPHEGYNFTRRRSNFDTEMHNIALLRLERPVSSEFIRPICLPDEEANPHDGRYIMAGWGAQPRKFDVKSNVKRNFRVNEVDRKSCETQLRRKLPQDVACARPKKQAMTCFADSGGALMAVNQRSVLTAVGIYTSMNVGNCRCDMWPNTYTDIRKYKKWIESHIR